MGVTPGPLSEQRTQRSVVIVRVGLWQMSKIEGSTDHRPVRPLQMRFAVEPNVDARKEITQDEEDNATIVDSAPYIEDALGMIDEGVISS